MRIFGFRETDIDIGFSTVMARVRDIASEAGNWGNWGQSNIFSATDLEIPPHGRQKCYSDPNFHPNFRLLHPNVDLIQGRAHILSPWEVSVNGDVLTTRAIVVATGAAPVLPRIPGAERVHILTTDSVWRLEHLPEKLIVLGSGFAACEMAQAFGRFGSRVTMVAESAQILPGEDPDASGLIHKRLETEGVRVLTGCIAASIDVKGDENVLTCTRRQNRVTETIRVEFTDILAAIGQKPRSAGLGLEEVGVAMTPDGAVEVSQYLQTRVYNIFCAGDVTGPDQFPHVAAYQADIAAKNALFAGIRKAWTDYRVVPWSRFTDPEFARVGLNETGAREKGIEYELTVLDMAGLPRDRIESRTAGMIKILTHPGKDAILGVTIVSDRAGNMIGEFALAMKNGLGLKKIYNTMHAYPNFAEAVRLAAGKWRTTSASPGLSALMDRAMTLARRGKKLGSE